MTKFCPECGEENEDVALFCAKCGHDLKDVDQRKKNDKHAKTSKNALNFKTLAALVVIVAIVGIIAFSFTGNSNEDIGNITVIKEYTYGYAFSNDGKTNYYNYFLEGVLKDLPSDYEGYDYRAYFYDENDKFVGSDDTYDMEYLVSRSKKSQSDLLASIQTTEYYNVSHIQLEIIDPNGDVIYNESVKFDMEKFDLSRLEK